jgi:hypothetical protein
MAPKSPFTLAHVFSSASCATAIERRRSEAANGRAVSARRRGDAGLGASACARSAPACLLFLAELLDDGLDLAFIRLDDPLLAHKFVMLLLGALEHGERLLVDAL